MRASIIRDIVTNKAVKRFAVLSFITVRTLAFPAHTHAAVLAGRISAEVCLTSWSRIWCGAGADAIQATATIQAGGLITLVFFTRCITDSAETKSAERACDKDRAELVHKPYLL